MGEVYNPQDLLKSRRASMLNVTFGDTSVGDIQKAQLVQKHIQVHAKNGKTFNSIRWINPETGTANPIHHKRYEHESNMEGATDAEKIQNVVHSSLDPREKTRKLISLGIYDKKHLDEITEQKYNRAHEQLTEAGIHNWKDYVNVGHNGDLPVTPEPGSADLSRPAVQFQAISDIQEKFGSKAAAKAQKDVRKELIAKYGYTVKDKWKGYKGLIESLLDNDSPQRAVLAYGTGGVGKTWTLNSVLNPEETGNPEVDAKLRRMIEYDPELDMEKNGPEYDYIKIGGKPGSAEVQKAMYFHRDKLIVWDDCDSVFEEGPLNVLKNCLDTSGNGRCNWAKAINDKDNPQDSVPVTFKFNGVMIFITNKSKDELTDKYEAGALVSSRCASVDLTMSMDQTIDQLVTIAPTLKLLDRNREPMPDVQLEDKIAGLEAFRGVAKYAKTDDLNSRVLLGMIGQARRMRRETGKYDPNELEQSALRQFGLF